MNKNRPVKPARDRRLYVICPTLDMMLASCDNVKQLAYDSGLDYSNFVKTCKFQRDIRLSTYQRCAEAFGMDTLILHLPLGAVESFASVANSPWESMPYGAERGLTTYSSPFSPA